MFLENKMLIAQSKTTGNRVFLESRLANRHGLIAGATGTGKTISVKVMAESFSAMGVPVFLEDVKGDLAGMCMPGTSSPNMEERIDRFGIRGTFQYRSFPTRFWDIYGQNGTPIRTTVSDMGPLLLSRLLGLTDVQEGVLSVVFRVADDEGMLLLDLKDLRAMLNYVAENAERYKVQYGNVASSSVGAIQRALLQLEDQGGTTFFGEPALDIADWFALDTDGRGIINILDAQRLIQTPLLYSTFLLWMLSELFERLPEVGDLDKPRLVFFFDEAHLLFDEAPKALLDKIEQVVKLVRSKGVGIYFCTQLPTDIPGKVATQLGNRVQHALRAYTPAEQKALKSVAEGFRTNPAFDTEKSLLELGIGEALISVLENKGEPSVVDICAVLPPESSMGAIDAQTRAQVIAASPLHTKYAQMIDRNSAYEVLMARASVATAQAQAAASGIDVQVGDGVNPYGGAQDAAAALMMGGMAASQIPAIAPMAAPVQQQMPQQYAPAPQQYAAVQPAPQAASPARKMRQRAAQPVEQAPVAEPVSVGGKVLEALFTGEMGANGRRKKAIAEKVFDSAVSTVASTAGRKIGSSLLRGILGSLTK